MLLSALLSIIFLKIYLNILITRVISSLLHSPTLYRSKFLSGADFGAGNLISGQAG